MAISILQDRGVSQCFGVEPMTICRVGGQEALPTGCDVFEVEDGARCPAYRWPLARILTNGASII